MVDDTVWITSGVDSHSTGLHPVGWALDYRSKNIMSQNLELRREQLKAWAARAQKRLGSDFDIIAEIHTDPNRDHIHGEFDPEE